MGAALGSDLGAWAPFDLLVLSFAMCMLSRCGHQSASLNDVERNFVAETSTDIS